jgi:hypothetical protein
MDILTILSGNGLEAGVGQFISGIFQDIARNSLLKAPLIPFVTKAGKKKARRSALLLLTSRYIYF